MSLCIIALELLFRGNETETIVHKLAGWNIKPSEMRNVVCAFIVKHELVWLTFSYNVHTRIATNGEQNEQISQMVLGIV